MLALRAVFRLGRYIRHDKAVIDQKNRLTERAFKKAGAYIRRTAQQSIRTSKYPAPPGRPPNTRKQRYLRRFIFYAYDERKQQVVVGPVMLSNNRGQHIPKVVEYGGRVFWENDRTGEKRMVGVRPHPFMRPALQKNLPKIAQMFDKAGMKGAAII